MSKSMWAAVVAMTLAFGAAGSAHAGVAGGGLGGLQTSSASELAQPVHWRPYYHRHWNKHRHWHRWHHPRRHCFWRHGHRVCRWR